MYKATYTNKKGKQLKLLPLPAEAIAPAASYPIGQPIECGEERDIFRVLGLPYKEPTERNTDDIDRTVVESKGYEDFEDEEEAYDDSDPD